MIGYHSVRAGGYVTTVLSTEAIGTEAVISTDVLEDRPGLHSNTSQQSIQ